MRAALLPAVVVLMTGGLAPSAAPAAAPTERAAPLASTGYILDSGSDQLVARDAHALATLGVAAVYLSRKSNKVSRIEGRLASTAHAHGLRAELLVSNYSDRLGGFDPKAAAKLLRRPENIERVSDRLVSLVVSQGWDGIQVDLESMSSKDADGLLSLVHALQAKMAPEKTVSIAVMASTDPREYAARGYRLAELGQAVDTLALMTYDQHGPWSGPGPIGALPWQRRAVAVVTAAVPATKVDLGVAAYGYTWPQGRTVTVKQARKLVARDGAKARWKKTPGEWTARLSDGTRLWWSDGRSYLARAELATALGLHGLALWRLGSGDPLP